MPAADKMRSLSPVSFSVVLDELLSDVLVLELLFEPEPLLVFVLPVVLLPDIFAPVFVLVLLLVLFLKLKGQSLSPSPSIS